MRSYSHLWKELSKMNKKIFLFIVMLAASGCTISDKYIPWNYTANNIGTAPTYYSPSILQKGDYGSCAYLFGIYKLGHGCSPNEYAKYKQFKTITSINTQWILYPFVLVQRNYVYGIPFEE